jgi:hypothetical protein
MHRVLIIATLALATAPPALADPQQDRKIVDEAGQRLTRPLRYGEHSAHQLVKSYYKTANAEAHVEGGQLTGSFVAKQYTTTSGEAISGRVSMDVAHGTGSGKFTLHEESSGQLGRPALVTGVKVTDDRAIGRGVQRSADGKTVRWSRQTVETFRVDPAKLSAIPEPPAPPRRGIARLLGLFELERGPRPSRPTAFDGVAPHVLAALRRGESFTLERLDEGSAQQSMPSLPRAARPATLYQRATSYRIEFKDRPMNETIPEAAYNALRGDLATKVALTP